MSHYSLKIFDPEEDLLLFAVHCIYELVLQGEVSFSFYVSNFRIIFIFLSFSSAE